MGEVKTLNLFSIIPQDFFKVLTSKNKVIYVDCLLVIYSSYKNELSFGVDKEVLVSQLEQYFEDKTEELVFDEDDIETAKDARSKAQGVLLRLKNSGWIEYDQPSDFSIKVSLLDYAITMIETFNKILSNEEAEYQSQVVQIYSTLINEENYKRPYEYILKSVIENTSKLNTDLKRLNTNIKKYIEAITNEKNASEIISDFFMYHDEIGSKSYHRLKTSDNISNFRNTIIERLRNILNDEQIFLMALAGFKEIENITNEVIASEQLREQILFVISAIQNVDEIIKEIDYKHSRYISSAIARAKFLLNNTNNTEGKVSLILNYVVEELNNTEGIGLNDVIEDDLSDIFNLFPQSFVDNDSLYAIPITRKMVNPEVFSNQMGLSQEERALRKLSMQERNKRRFSLKNINTYVNEVLKENRSVLASTLPLHNKRDLIRVIFISLYGRDAKSTYRVRSLDKEIVKSGFKFNDFMIERIK